MSAISKRNFVLILKALQALSVGAVNSREPWLSVILSQTSIKAIQNWYSQVIDIQFNPGSIHGALVCDADWNLCLTFRKRAILNFADRILHCELRALHVQRRNLASLEKERSIKYVAAIHLYIFSFKGFTGLMDRVGTKIRKQSFLNLEDNDQSMS